MERTSLYLHVPFCRHRCSYCDFNTFAGQDRMIPAYVAGLCAEIQQVSASAPERIPVHTIFFGGGTPSLLSVEQLAQIFAKIHDCFDVEPQAEITLEANPGTVSPTYLSGLRQTGVNRLSFGMQSAHPDDLRLLERQHDFFDVLQAVGWARAAGFDNLSVDLIFGLPGQSLERWQATLERTMAMELEHISLYALTIEHGTPLYKRWGRGMIPLVNEDLAADMYDLAIDRLPEAGYVQYEISNWAKPEPGAFRFDELPALRTCRHNLQYWYNQPYLGFGPGAHGFASGMRTMNIGGIRPFVERTGVEVPVAKKSAAKPVQGGSDGTRGAGLPQAVIERAAQRFPAGPATRRTIPIDRWTEMQETMMVGLRLTLEGVTETRFRQRFGEGLEDVFGKEIRLLVRKDLLEWLPTQNENRRLRLTRRGRLLGNQVFMQFVG